MLECPGCRVKIVSSLQCYQVTTHRIENTYHHSCCCPYIFDFHYRNSTISLLTPVSNKVRRFRASVPDLARCAKINRSLTKCFAILCLCLPFPPFSRILFGFLKSSSRTDQHLSPFSYHFLRVLLGL
jgi:hypothetical protein